MSSKRIAKKENDTITTRRVTMNVFELVNFFSRKRELGLAMNTHKLFYVARAMISVIELSSGNAPAIDVAKDMLSKIARELDDVISELEGIVMWRRAGIAKKARIIYAALFNEDCESGFSDIIRFGWTKEGRNEALKALEAYYAKELADGDEPFWVIRKELSIKITNTLYKNAAAK